MYRQRSVSVALSLLILSAFHTVRALEAPVVNPVAATPEAALALGLENARKNTHTYYATTTAPYGPDGVKLFDQLFTSAGVLQAVKGAQRVRPLSAYELSVVAVVAADGGYVYQIPLDGFTDLRSTVDPVYSQVTSQHRNLFDFNLNTGKRYYTAAQIWTMFKPGFTKVVQTKPLKFNRTFQAAAVHGRDGWTVFQRDLNYQVGKLFPLSELLLGMN